jgi:hypothetical protein
MIPRSPTPWFVPSSMLAASSANILPSDHEIRLTLERLRAVLDRAELIHALNRMNRTP